MKKFLRISAIFFSILILFFIIGLYFINSSSKSFSFKNLFGNDTKAFIKRYIFPQKLIEAQNNKIKRQANEITQLKFLLGIDKKETLETYLSVDDELKFKNLLLDIKSVDTKKINLNKNLILTKYRFLSGFYSGIKNRFPGSGYIDFHNSNLVILSARGIIGYQSKISDDLVFTQIPNNLNQFINIKHIRIDSKFSFKDLHIHNNEVYVSYTEEKEKNCWNTSILFASFNKTNLEFEKFFSSEDCNNSISNKDGEFSSGQSGGRIIHYDKDNIILSIGDYRQRYRVQLKNFINGKVIKINKKNKNYEILSMGHRNPQGLLYDEDEKFLLQTEHGPKHGDEINIIKLNTNIQEIPNYGWPIVSYGEHYGGRSEKNKIKYEKYPLLKPHADHGFIEPLKYFYPGVAISEIVKIGKRTYIASSLKKKSIFIFNLDKSNKIKKFQTVEIFERVRDLKFLNKKLYLFMENTASLGIIDFANFNLN